MQKIWDIHNDEYIRHDPRWVYPTKSDVSLFWIHLPADFTDAQASEPWVLKTPAPQKIDDYDDGDEEDVGSDGNCDGDDDGDDDDNDEDDNDNNDNDGNDDAIASDPWALPG